MKFLKKLMSTIWLLRDAVVSVILAWFSFWFWNCKLTQDADEG